MQCLKQLLPRSASGPRNHGAHTLSGAASQTKLCEPAAPKRCFSVAAGGGSQRLGIRVRKAAAPWRRPNGSSTIRSRAAVQKSLDRPSWALGAEKRCITICPSAAVAVAALAGCPRLALRLRPWCIGSWERPRMRWPGSALVVWPSVSHEGAGRAIEGRLPKRFSGPAMDPISHLATSRMQNLVFMVKISPLWPNTGQSSGRSGDRPASHVPPSSSPPLLLLSPWHDEGKKVGG